MGQDRQGTVAYGILAIYEWRSCSVLQVLALERRSNLRLLQLNFSRARIEHAIIMLVRSASV